MGIHSAGKRRSSEQRLLPRSTSSSPSKSTQESDHHNSINQPSPSNSNLPSLSEISHLDNQHARLHDNLPPQAAPSRTISSEYQPSRPVPPHLPSSASTNQAPSAQPTRLPLAPTKQLIYSSIESIDFAAASIPLTENSDSAALNRLLSSFIEQARLQDGNLKLPSSPLDPQDLESLRLALCPPAHVQLNPSSPFYDLCSSSPTSHPSSGPYFYDQTSKNQRPLRKRALPDDHRLLLPRQSTQGNGSGPSADGYPGCTAVSNAILSCFPEPRTVLTQHTWSKFIWNNNYPTFIGSRLVDIYLYNANSESPVANWTQIPNDRGMIGIYADDSWFPPVTSWQDGRNLTYPYFFIITTAGATLTGGEQHQATFRVVQTAPPQAYITASLASASHSSQLAASMTTNSLLTPSATPNSNLQRGPSGDAFPRWEIALIVVLGAFALLIFLVAAYLAFTNARKRRQVRIWQAAALGGKSVSGGSIASHSPMIQNTEGAALIGNQKSRGGAGVTSARDLHSPNSSRPGSPLSAVNAPSNTFGFPPGEHHPTGSEAVATPDGPITSVDATIMADAFRKALRKPEFALPENVPGDARSSSSQPVRAKTPLNNEHPNPDESASNVPYNVRESMHAQVISADDDLEDNEDDDDGEEAKEIMDRELASEGRSMTSVDNRKRPQVHG
ncbi:hypothetical protein MJO28_001410 [Puccinia striiformis f. sp. tritici]|uniref:Uncharacterized protein n=3 Tax=Puccinia striiformis TaxID=27350 RepID=A0A0L0VR32_9BASI|nr:hypothetical protein Pst134EA_003322 [Puccinia striiformis f. sp. tritici]KAI9620102.1 hypothetical protein KEM48_008304 [Puccinia striiformis f. sp. tritici PST-130]KNF01667.1 hypothetical protein PSTG_05098 [Puccinia striiformis f. sp. tritici PST-78]POW16327.1 hypothetical protein PSTT_01428 [Puccinia striiformis]KAH9464885.1 hypothetical protein Pst134EB_004390 [Puccinia striiformis f. sp. tritici]KAH9472715.1 hypothetical protein Pst134EA_003322 [Puccinia striiformis f. sp. tritici]